MGPRGVPNNVQNRGVPLFFTPDFISSYNLQQAQNAANQANERRYQQAMSELVNLRSQNMADVGSMGASMRSEIMQKSQADLAAIRQEMTQRGLAHSTVLPAVLAGASRQRNRDLLALYDQLNQARVNARSQATGQIVNLIASKNEISPDPGAAAALGRGVGAGGGYGYGYGGMGAGMGMNPMIGWQQNMARLAAMQNRPAMAGSSRVPGYQGPMAGPRAVPYNAGAQRNWNWWDRPMPGTSYRPGMAIDILAGPNGEFNLADFGNRRFYPDAAMERPLR